jgi:tripartite-type tricarboxylate transporter receptor subunit TctC
MTLTKAARHLALGLCMLAGVAATTSAARAQDYPDKSIKMVVPFPAGAATDAIARLVAQKLAARWNVPVIVENRAGATGSIGSNYVAKSAPDGYTLLVATSSSHTMAPYLSEHNTWDPIKDFEPVGLLAWAPNVLVVNPKLKVHTVKELIALLKKSPGKYTFASSGTGSSIQLAGELFKTQAGVKMVHVPYKGAAPAITDLVGGQVDMMFDTVAQSLPFIQSGKLTALAVTPLKRSSSLPQVPTMHEAGVKDYEMAAWIGLLAPAGTPQAVVDKLSGALREVLDMPDVREQMAQRGLDQPTETRQQFGELIARELPKYADIMRQAGLKPGS